MEHSIIGKKKSIIYMSLKSIRHTLLLAVTYSFLTQFQYFRYQNLDEGPYGVFNTMLPLTSPKLAVCPISEDAYDHMEFCGQELNPILILSE